MKLMNNELQEREKKRDLGLQKPLDAHKLNSKCLNDKASTITFPYCLKLLHLMLIFPLSTACVKRFFSKMEIVKTQLLNMLSQANLENLFIIATEAPKTGFTDSKYFFVNELKKII